MDADCPADRGCLMCQTLSAADKFLDILFFQLGFQLFVLREPFLLQLADGFGFGPSCDQRRTPFLLFLFEDVQRLQLFFELALEVIEIPFKGLHLQDIEAATPLLVQRVLRLLLLISDLLYLLFLLHDPLQRCRMLGAQIVFILCFLIQYGFQ